MLRLRDRGESDRWFWIGIDVGIVAVGILIAFVLESWWGDRIELTREKSHLRALQSDFQQNVDHLREHIALEERIAHASLQLLRLSRSNGEIERDSAVNYIGEVFSSDRFQPVMGAYATIINSGELSLIQDDTLRRSMAEFAALIETRYSESFEDRLYLTFIQEFMGRLGWLDWLGDEDLQALGLPRRPWDHTSLLSDSKFDEYLMVRFVSARDVAAYYRNLAGHAESILARLESEASR